MWRLGLAVSRSLACALPLVRTSPRSHARATTLFDVSDAMSAAFT
jgi:hypothetical protein